jgi:hypothetical protein
MLNKKKKNKGSNIDRVLSTSTCVPIRPVVSEEIFKRGYNDVGRQLIAKAHMAYKVMGAN